MDEESSDCKSDCSNSWLRRFLRKPLPHRPKQHLASKYMCCDFKLNLRPFRYDVIHRGVTVSYPQQRTPLFMGSVPVEQPKGMLTIWKPYLRRLCDILIPRVYASEAQVQMDQNEAEIIVERTLEEKITSLREQFNLGKPVDELAEEYISKETGWERLQEMYGEISGEECSPELMELIEIVKSTIYGVGFVSFFLGCIKEGSQFEEQNYHTKWRTRYLAMRKLNDTMIFAGFKMAIKWMFRSTIFFGPWFTVATTIAVYRNKTGIIEHVAGGAIGGATTGLNMGLRGIFARGVIGGAFGTLLGCTLYPATYITGMRQEDKRFWTIVERIEDKRRIGQTFESKLLEDITEEMDYVKIRKASNDELKASSHQEDSDTESESEPT